MLVDVDLSLSCCPVSQAALDPAPHRYQISFFPQARPCLAHIHLPLLLPHPHHEEKYYVLSGADSLPQQQEPFPALIIPANTAPLHIFRLILQHRVLYPGLSSMEQALFFHRAEEVLAPEEVLTLLPELGLQPDLHVVQQLLSLLTLHPAAQISLHRGKLSLNAAKKLHHLASSAQEILVNLVEELHLGGSKQQKVIDLLVTLMKRRQQGLAEILGPWQQQECKQENNLPQRAAALLSYLEQQVQPRLHEAEEQFHKACKQLQLPQGLHLSHSPAFEEDWVRLHIDFPNMEALIALWPRLRQHVQHD